MAHMASESAIRATKSLEDQISAAGSQAEIQQILREAAVEQKLVVPDIYDPNVLIPTEAAVQPRNFAKTVTINGQKHVIEGSTETELAQTENALYRKLFAQPAAAARTEPTRDADTGRFRSAADQTVSDDDKAALALQFQIGTISAAEYI